MMALDRIPADIRNDGGIARMADPKVSVEDRGPINRLVFETVQLRSCHTMLTYYLLFYSLATF